MSMFQDPIREGLAQGWRVLGGGHAPLPAQLDCDVAIVGSGAGAGISAELLVQAGLKVVIIEAGPLRSSSDFKQREADAYTTLYQEGAARKTADKAFNILQGRCVGGSTTVNWTSSFRTPADTLAFWGREFGLTDLGEAAMAPWFARAEARLNVHDWEGTPNANNSALERGLQVLKLETKRIPRNVKGCWNLGSCGLGCPTNAKQSMLLTTIPAALAGGATLLVQTRAERLEWSGDTVQAIVCRPVALNDAPAGPELRVRARHYLVAGGAINSPALLLRSQAPDPHQRLGRRTFLHPVVISAAMFDEAIEGWAGAPQSVYTDHYLHTDPIDGPLGFKLEVPPLHPALMASTLVGLGEGYVQTLKQFPHAQAVLALLRDGFHPESPGGRVQLRGDGSPVLDYPINATLLDGARRALLAMAELQFAAGARTVMPLHEQGRFVKSWAEARAQIQALPLGAQQLRLVSAHVMGGCGMAADASRGVVRPDGRHWQLRNLSVHDGSLFPTSIGANPQLSIYGLATRLTVGLARELGGRDLSHPGAA